MGKLAFLCKRSNFPSLKISTEQFVLYHLRRFFVCMQATICTQSSKGQIKLPFVQFAIKLNVLCTTIFHRHVSDKQLF